MSPSKNRKPEAAFLLGLGMAMALALPALAQQRGDPNEPIIRQQAPETADRPNAECTAYAMQTAYEEFPERSQAIPSTGSARTEGGVDVVPAGAAYDITVGQRSERQGQLYSECMTRLGNRV